MGLSNLLFFFVPKKRISKKGAVTKGKVGYRLVHTSSTLLLGVGVERGSKKKKKKKKKKCKKKLKR